jgi:hypothetical protein
VFVPRLGLSILTASLALMMIEDHHQLAMGPLGFEAEPGF